MDVSASSILHNFNLFCRLSSAEHNPTRSKLFSRHSLRKASPHSFLLSKAPSWRCESTLGRRAVALQVSAMFQPPSRRRRNSLRDKLRPLRHEDQVNTILDLPTPDLTLQSSKFVDGESMNIDSKVNFNSEKEVISNASSGKSDSSSKDSILWDKLENWVDQYKADSEFWGIGANPIFSLYQDSQGKVVRVTVDEDEIVKRSRIRAWSPEEKEGTAEFMDSKAKISRAKLIARMIESGEYALPKNSSVIKYVVQGNKKSFLQGIHSLSAHIPLSMKTFGRGSSFMLLCGCCVFWALIQLFIRNDNVELSTEEAEMLRRKVKLRMEREEFDKGTIKVLQSEPESLLSLSSRPQLDKRELMKDIMQAKEAPNNNLVIKGSYSHLECRDHEFDDKIREIKEMARKAREIEQKHISEHGVSETRGDEVSSELLDNGSLGGKENHAILNPKPTEKASDPSCKPTLQPKQEESTIIHIRANQKTELEQEAMERVDNVSFVELLNRFQEDGNNLKKAVNGAPQIGTDGGSIVSIEETSTVTEDDLENGEEVECNEMKSFFTEDRTSSNGSCSASTFRSKPRVITSVEEAKEYLRRKGNIISDKLQPYNEMNVKALPAEASMSDDVEQVKDVNMKGETADATGISAIMEDAQAGILAAKHYGDQSDASVSNHQFDDDLSISKPNEGPCSCESSTIQNIEKTGGKSVTLPERANIAFNFSHLEISKGINSYKSPLGSSAENDEFYKSASFQTKFLNGVQDDVKDRIDAQVSNTSDNNAKVHLLNIDEIVTSVLPTTVKNDEVCYSQDTNDVKDEKILDKKKEVQEAADGFDIRDEKNRLLYDTGAVIAGSVTNGSFKSVPRQEIASSTSNSIYCMTTKQDIDGDGHQSDPLGATTPGDMEAQTFTAETLDNSSKEGELMSFLKPEVNSSRKSNVVDSLKEEKQLIHEKSWLEQNFQDLDSVIEKIGVGFKENYMVAKEKVQNQPILDVDINDLRSLQGNGEPEWMNDEVLRKIVFQVRENELAGRDPFHSMTAADKSAFFNGLESIAEMENNKLLHLHEWIHSRIENLDYGSEGISLYDPVEKVIPCWKGPPIDKDLDFLAHHKPIISEREINQNSLQKMEEMSNSVGMSSNAPIKDIQKSSTGTSDGKLKTVIECSDGTIRPGKKKGKEQWQHSKKWSRGFLEVYNAETDPEIKSVLRDMGKDLDRWTTEKELHDAADLMTKIPKRKRMYIEKKMERIKREVQMFGAPAVVSKYKEYADDKEEDYLSWLDLPYVLCIELYTVQEGTPSVGFYSLEMAADLDLNPKQYHVIAFEDPGDSKNLCYIIQAHMDMLGSGKAFVIARPPKDAFREAKANGFSVTVIRKGELKLNIDQTLEEVEEEITEIGSKIYHDKIMRERSVNINTLMKGVVVADRSTKRKTKRTKKTVARPSLKS